jgi:hypothetical protein
MIAGWSAAIPVTASTGRYGRLTLSMVDKNQSLRYILIIPIERKNTS